MLMRADAADLANPARIVTLDEDQMPPLIAFRDVSKTFSSGSSTVKALDSITLQIEAGDIFAIIGYSGAGKSTLVRLINALEAATSGEVSIEGIDITRLGERDVRPIRARTGMIFQQFNLIRSRTVFGNVAFPLRIAKWPKYKRRQRVAELLNFVGLAEKAWAHPDQLSGGQKQRVGIARALATNPSILLADEATSALDPETSQDVLKLLRRVNSELGVTIVVITHEMEVVRTIANRVAVLDAGRLVEEGSVFDIFSAPKAEITRKFVDTALKNRPEAVDTARLQERYDARLVSVRIGGEHQIGAILTDAVRRSDVRFEIVYGGITALQGRSFGDITLALSGADQDVEGLIADLKAAAEIEEIG